MSLFRTNEKAYDLAVIKEELIKKLIKEDKKLNKEELSNLIEETTNWHIRKMDYFKNELYKDESLLNLALESKQLLLEMFDNNSLFQHLFVQKSYENKKFINDDQFRRKVLLATLYNVINKGNKQYGSEYGLVYSKTYNFDLTIPFRYVSYSNGMVDPELKKYIDVYSNLGGPIDTYFLPKYFESDKKDRYDIEFLSTILTYYRNQDNLNNINPSVYAKKFKKNS